MTDKTSTMIEKLTADLGENIRIFQELDEGNLMQDLEVHEMVKPTPWLPKYVHAKAFEAMNSIRGAIECGEPETVADILSLAILARDRIADIFPGSSVQDEDQRKISAVMASIIRGLDRLSPGHPLVTTRYFVSDQDFQTSKDEIAMIRTAIRSITDEAA